MPAIVERRQGQTALMPHLPGVPAHAFEDLGHHKGVQAGIGMQTVVLRAADRHEDDVILAPLFNLLAARRGLDVAARLAQLRWAGDLIIRQDLVDLVHRGIPDLLLQAPGTGILEKDRRVVSRVPLFFSVTLHVGCPPGVLVYLCTRPEPEPPLRLMTSSMLTRLKSPMIECLRQLAATANSSASCLPCRSLRP